MVEKIFSGGKSKWLTLYKQIHDIAECDLQPFSENLTTNSVVWKNNASFVDLTPKKDCITLAVTSNELHQEWLPKKIMQTSKNRFVHYFEVRDVADFKRLMPFIKEAYALLSSSKAQRNIKKDVNYDTVEEYIASFPKEIANILENIRSTIIKAAPQALEKISWKMPTYYLKENLVHFAAQKDHIGFYPTPNGIEAFSKVLSDYKTTKGGVQFPLSQPIPYDIISDITKYRVDQVTK